MTIQEAIDRLELLKKNNRLGPDALLVLRAENHRGRVTLSAIDHIGVSCAYENDGLGLKDETEVVSVELVRF
jgi:hypothetical protein